MNKLFSLFLLSSAALFTAHADIVPAQNNKGKWGYIDEDTQKEVISYRFDEARMFDNGVAIVAKGNKYGLINRKGKELLNVRYDIVELASPGIFRIAADGKHKDGVLLDEKYGFASSDGTILLKPEYEEVGLFNNGLAYIKKDNKYGYINERIDLIIPCRFNFVGTCNEQGFVWVAEGGKIANGKINGSKFGIYDRNGNIIVPVKYRSVGTFIPFVLNYSDEVLEKLSYDDRTVTTESGSYHLLRKNQLDPTPFSRLDEDVPGFYASSRNDGKKNSVVSTDGIVIVSEGKFENAFYPTEGLAPVSNNANKYNFLDIKSGKLLLKNNVKDVWAFQDGVAVIDRTGDGMELINTAGNPVSARYDEIYPRKEGLYVVRSGSDKWGAIDSEGKEILTPTHSMVYPPVNGLLACSEGTSPLCGFKNLKGEWVVKPRFNAVRSFKGVWASALTDNGWGLIDTAGNEVVKCQWANIYIRFSDDEDILMVTDQTGDNAGYMMLDIRNDKLISTDRYKWYRSFGRDFDDAAVAGLDSDHLGVVDRNGNLLVPMMFNYSDAVFAYKYMKALNKTVWEEFDTYRLKLYANPERNRARLSEKISSKLWDY